CDGFADAGYEVIAPALFDRVERGVELGYDEEGFTRGRALRAESGTDNAVRDVAAAAAALSSAGRIGCVGYCWGGTIAWLAGTRLGLSCAVGYYGAQIVAYNHEHPQCPVTLHYGEHDASTPADDIRRVRESHADVAVHLYPAGHGFNCDQRTGDHHAESAALARERTLAFFAEHLG
ncbi:MAG: dienelactone hydrolase family protein, partial [Alphaproteobacteria bacterium]